MTDHLPEGALEIEDFADVPVTVEVRIGCREATLEEIAKLDVGGALRLDKPAGETLDLFVGELPLGTAEVIVVEDRLTIRITDLFLPESEEAPSS